MNTITIRRLFSAATSFTLLAMLAGCVGDSSPDSDEGDDSRAVSGNHGNDAISGDNAVAGTGVNIGNGAGSSVGGQTGASVLGGGQRGGLLSSLTILVQRYDYWLVQSEPAAGALVAFDLPSGERLQQIADDRGRVEFFGIDWSAGESGAVTAYLPGHLVTSYLGLIPQYLDEMNDLHKGENGELVVWVDELEPSIEMARIHGSVTGMADLEHSLLVGSSTVGASHESVGRHFALEVPAGEPFTLLATEVDVSGIQTVSSRGIEQTFLKWASRDYDPNGNFEAVDLDLDDRLTPFTVNGSFGIGCHTAIPRPALSDFFDTAHGYATVWSMFSGFTLATGFPTRIDVDAGGYRFEYDIEYVVPPAMHAFVTEYSVSDFQSRYSGVRKAGVPQMGDQDFQLPEPAVIANGAPLSIDEPIEWQLNFCDARDRQLEVMVLVSSEDGPAARLGGNWAVFLPPGSTSVSLPELPSAIDPDKVFGSGDATLQVATCEPSVDFGRYCGRYSYSQKHALQRSPQR